jgi:hypothetical protein
MLTSWRRWEGDDAKMGGGPLQRRGIFWIRVVGTNPFVDSGEGEVGKEKEVLKEFMMLLCDWSYGHSGG